MHHPVMMGSDKKNIHLAEILDAGVKGMRVRVTNQTGFQVGREVEVSSLPLHNRAGGITLHCQVAWEDAENFEVGLKYLQ